MPLPNITEVLLEGRNVALNWYKWFEEVVRTKVDSNRQVATGTGLQGGGDLKQNLTISIADIAGLVVDEYGDATHIPVITVNQQGQITAITVVDLGSSTDPGALQIANNLSDLGDLTIAQTNLGLAPVALSGAYADLTGLPTISTVGHTGDYSDLIGAPALASVATSGSASDLGSGTLAAARLPQYTGGDVTTAGAGSVNLVIGALKVTTAMVQNSAITLAKMADMATASFLGRNTAGAGAPEVLSKATTKAMLDLTGVNSGDQTITLTGDVIGSGTGSFATTFKTNPVFTETITVNATTAGLACFNGNTQSGMMIGTRFSSDASGCTMRLMKARGTIASPATTVQNDESFRLIGRHYYSSSATVENFHLVSTLKTATPGVGDGESAFALKLCPAASATLTTFLSGDFATGLSLSSNVFIDANRHFKLRSYTVATVPSASVAGMLIYVSDGTSNKRLAVSDGTNWRWPDGAIVS